MKVTTSALPEWSAISLAVSLVKKFRMVGIPFAAATFETLTAV